jgi:hypothetical protein
LEIFNMKKTLVALAAVAATGGAFAQSTMTGSIGFGYTQTALGATSGGSGTTTSGFGSDDSSLTWATTEDLGDGMKVTASIGINAGVSGVATTGKDEFITVSGAFGAIQLGSLRGASYLSGGVASAGSLANSGLNGTVLPSRKARDTINWAFDVMPGLKAKINLEEDDTTEGTGVAGSTAQGRTTYQLTYSAGPLVVDGGYRSYDKQGTGTSETLYSSMVRAAASYDLGMAKVGFGVENYTAPYGNTRNNTLVGMSVPVGKAVLGAQFATNTTSGSATAANNQTLNATLVNATYNLSKRTSLIAEYIQSDVGYVSAAGATAFVTSTSTYTAAGSYGKQNFGGVYIYHSF